MSKNKCEELDAGLRRLSLQNTSRMDEGERIEIEGVVETEVLTRSPRQNHNLEYFDVNDSSYFLSCPRMALKVLENSLFFFHGALVENPSKSDELKPIIDDIRQRMKAFEDRISVLNE